MLKESHPEIYAEHVKKYDDRQHLLERKIPTLDCLWNDVLHLTAVHPTELRDAFAKAGHSMVNSSWFKIPIEVLDPKLLTVYLYNENKANRLSVDPGEFVDFDMAKIETYKKIGDKTIQYYKDRLAEGNKPMMFHLVPHILYKGEIETKDLEIVSPYEK